MKKLKLSNNTNNINANNVNNNNADNNNNNNNNNNNKPSIKINKNKINLNNTSNNNSDIIEPKLNQEQSMYKDVREELLQDFIDDMKENSINIEMSQEDIENAHKKHKSLMMKKKVSYASIILLFLSIIGFGTYKTFFQRNYTGQEIALLANKYNNKTNFPESVVEGYLSNNIDKLLKDKLTLNSDVEEIQISSPIITRINAKNDNLANVYFYTNIHTNMGDSKINCVMPIYWDGEAQECSPAGSIMITPNKSTAENVKEKKNDLLSFEDIQTETDENINSSKTFIDNFFNMLYSNQDISPYYKGDLELESNDLIYDGINEYVLYKSANKNGYNATCKITLKMPNGTSYSTQKYLTIKKSGESWIVIAVL